MQDKVVTSTSIHLSLVLMLSSSLMEVLSWMVQQRMVLPRQRTGLPMLQTSPTDSLSMVVSTHTTHEAVLSLLRLHLVQTLILLQPTLVNTLTPLQHLLLSLLLPHQHKLPLTTSNVSVSCFLMVTLSVPHTWTTRHLRRVRCRRCSWDQRAMEEVIVASNTLFSQ